jgi:hypothetical protein
MLLKSSPPPVKYASLNLREFSGQFPERPGGAYGDNLLGELFSIDCAERDVYVSFLVRTAKERGLNYSEFDIKEHLESHSASAGASAGAGQAQGEMLWQGRMNMVVQMVFWGLYWLHQWVGVWDASPEIHEWVMPLNVFAWMTVPLFLGWVICCWRQPIDFVLYVLGVAIFAGIVIAAILSDPSEGNLWTAWYE